MAVQTYLSLSSVAYYNRIFLTKLILCLLFHVCNKYLLNSVFFMPISKSKPLLDIQKGRVPSFCSREAIFIHEPTKSLSLPIDSTLPLAIPHLRLDGGSTKSFLIVGKNTFL
jgi:hypothetical protein